MKRAVLVLLILSLCLALCACGEPQVIEKEVEVEKIVEVIPDEYEQFWDIVDALVREDYDSAQALIEAMKPEPEKPPIVEVSITTENFFDYFEYVEFHELETSTEKDSAGNTTIIHFSPGFYLKDKYSLAKERYNDCKVEVGLKYNVISFWGKNGITIDFDNYSYNVTGKPVSSSPQDKHLESRCYQTEPNYTFFINLGWGLRLTYDQKWGSDTIDKDSINLVSASGTLYLYE